MTLKTFFLSSLALKTILKQFFFHNLKGELRWFDFGWLRWVYKVKIGWEWLWWVDKVRNWLRLIYMCCKEMTQFENCWEGLKFWTKIILFEKKELNKNVYVHSALKWLYMFEYYHWQRLMWYLWDILISNH